MTIQANVVMVRGSEQQYKMQARNCAQLEDCTELPLQHQVTRTASCSVEQAIVQTEKKHAIRQRGRLVTAPQ